MDPVLFENFLTEDGDLLRAKFQAFKFPETNFVLFKGIVNVCLDRCNGVQCSNGQVGFGRRKKRDLDDSPSEIQRVYEVSMSTIVKVGDEKTDIVVKDSQGNQKETFVSEEAVISEIYAPEELAIARLAESFGASPAKYIDFDQENNNAASIQNNLLVSMVLMAFMLALLWAQIFIDFNPDLANLNLLDPSFMFPYHADLDFMDPDFCFSPYIYIQKKLTLMSLTPIKVEHFSPPTPPKNILYF